MRQIKCLIFLLTLLVSSFPLFAAEVYAQKATSVWGISQRDVLGGELYQTAFLRDKMMTICLTRHQVVGIDPGRKVFTFINLMPGQRANLSTDGRFVSVMTAKREFIDLFELKTIDGKSILTIKPIGTFVSFLVGKDAQMVVGVSVEKPPESLEVPFTYHFYDIGGKEIGKAKAINPTGSSLAPDGKAFVFNDPQAGMMAFSQNGLKLWGVDESYRAFSVSNGAHRTIGNSAGFIDRIDLFEDGNPIGRYSFGKPVHKVAISPEGKSIVATDARTIRSFGDKLQLVWEHAFGDKSLTINSIAVSDNGLVACGLLKDNGPQVPPEKRYTKGQAALFDRGGKIIWEKAYDLNLANAWIPKVTLTPLEPNKMILTVQTREQLFRYEIQY